METTISSNHFLQTLPVSIPSHVNQKKLVIVQTTDGGSLNGRQRRMMKNERREQLKASRQLWREQIDDKILEYEDRKRKQAKRRGYEMDVNMLSAKGSQWWLVFVPKDAEAVVAKNLAGALSASFPGRECDVWVPIVPSKRRLKNGTYSTAKLPLYPGCVFFRILMDRGAYDVVSRVPGVKGFFGSRVGKLIQIVMPTPLPAYEIEGLLRKIKEEEDDLERLETESLVAE
eukprot:c25026_g1_i2 orf=122-811(+)